MATVLNKDPARAERERERQKQFRKQFVEETPSWYRGEYHLAFMLTVTLGTIWYCWAHIENVTGLEWIVILPMLLFGNYIEWAAHRYILHRPVKGLEAIYKRHCAVHHQFFTDHDLSYGGHKDWRALLFPPFAPVAFILAAVPPALLLAAIWSSNVGYIAVGMMAVYYLMYEGLHTLSHLEDHEYPWLRHVPLVNTIRRMHRVHHDLGQMQTRNFNLTFPICDALFGTSDLNRGLLGTLFNGDSEEHARSDNRYTPPPKEFYGDMDEAEKRVPAE